MQRGCSGNVQRRGHALCGQTGRSIRGREYGRWSPPGCSQGSPSCPPRISAKGVSPRRLSQHSQVERNIPPPPLFRNWYLLSTTFVSIFASVTAEQRETTQWLLRPTQRPSGGSWSRVCSGNCWVGQGTCTPQPRPRPQGERRELRGWAISPPDIPPWPHTASAATCSFPISSGSLLPYILTRLSVHFDDPITVLKNTQNK